MSSLFVPTDAEVKGDYQEELDFRRDLVAEFKWLAGWDLSLPEFIAESLHPVIDSPSTYEPLLIDNQLLGASSALDRALTLRNEIFTLETTAINFALAKRYKAAVNPLLLNLEKIRAKSEAEHSAILALHQQIAISERVAERRYLAPGSATHFAERRLRSLEVFKRELTEAFERAKAFKQGMELVYGNPIKKLPDPLASIRFLEEFVVWIRDAMHELELTLNRQTTFQIEVPLRQWFFRDDGTTTRLLEDAGWGEVRNLRRCSFSTIEFFRGLFGGKFKDSVLRLQALGAFYTLPSDGVKDNNLNFGLKVLLYPPVQPSKAISQYAAAPFVLLGNVGYDVRPLDHIEMQPVSIAGGNVNPRGQWTIEIDSTLSFPARDAKSFSDGSIPIDDIRLLMSIACLH